MRALSGALIVIALCAGGLAARGAEDESKLLPAGPGKDLVVQSCQICHSLTLVTQQRLPEKSWLAELVKMEKWGAPLAETDNAKVAAYLAQHFKPDVPDAAPKMVKSPKTPG